MTNICFQLVDGRFPAGSEPSSCVETEPENENRKEIRNDF